MKRVFYKVDPVWYAPELGGRTIYGRSLNNTERCHAIKVGLAIYKVEQLSSELHSRDPYCGYYRMILVDYIEEKVEEILP